MDAAERPSECFEAVVTAIDEVAQEDIVRVRNSTASSEELLQVVELTMNVSTNGDWRRDWLHIGLLHEKVADQVTKFLKAASFSGLRILKVL